MMEMSGRALAKLIRLLCQYKWPRERELEPVKGLKYRLTRNRAVGPLTACLREVTGRADQT
jgi:hypothetical protein